MIRISICSTFIVLSKNENSFKANKDHHYICNFAFCNILLRVRLKFVCFYELELRLYLFYELDLSLYICFISWT